MFFMSDRSDRHGVCLLLDVVENAIPPDAQFPCRQGMVPQWFAVPRLAERLMHQLQADR
jgi:hypothetical protein